MAIVYISKALKELKVSGFIIQSPNPADGRELRTSISDEGKQLLANISAKHTALYQTAIKVMTKEERTEFARLSEKLSNALKEERVEKYE